MSFNFYSPGQINQFLQNNNLDTQKKFGQHFLINAGVVDTIIEQCQINSRDPVVEIGCGLGSLTNRLLKTKCHLTGCEIDLAYIKHLKKLFGQNPNFQLIEGDFLKNIPVLIEQFKDLPLVFTGNLPYNITSPILDSVFTSGFNYQKACFMMQKEVADRIQAQPGTKEYSSISIFCQYYNKIAIIAKVSPGSFYPPPRVQSAVVLFEKDNQYQAANEELFFQVSRSLFLNRRKQIKNNLLKSSHLQNYPKELILKALQNTKIPETIRGECLSIQQIIQLADEIHHLKSFF
ncbi:MAG: 16S rRNA (adenine(1518)-N(6)/adenine(1519)-N(6))-dimethyltransferase RsmA [Spirochaetes bacterium]|nr:16S rRNA (adenine(1518)-N(6)/adenine(1519)-N(6))-dimethyltransferase RsmA [Spirochaetota bacterium]